MKVSAPTTSTTNTSSPQNSGVCVGKVPAPTGTAFLAARLPAKASTGMAVQKRPVHMLRDTLPNLDFAVDLFASVLDRLPDFDRETEYVALVSPAEYAMNKLLSHPFVM